VRMYYIYYTMGVNKTALTAFWFHIYMTVVTTVFRSWPTLSWIGKPRSCHGSVSPKKTTFL